MWDKTVTAVGASSRKTGRCRFGRTHAWVIKWNADGSVGTRRCTDCGRTETIARTTNNA